MANMNAFVSRFKYLDSHHKMERFAVMFLAFVSAILMLFVISFKIHRDHMKVNLTTQAMYTERTQWSITGQWTEILNIYRNNDSSKVFILMKIGKTPKDMLNMSTDANDYQILMTGYKNDPLTNTSANAAVYMFGSTGYMGLYFWDTRGFDPHVYDIVVRNNKVLTSEVDESAQKRYKDMSYQNFNQIHLYANLSGSDAEVKDFLNTESPAPSVVYADIIASIDEAKTREVLNDDLQAMNNCMLKLNQYTEALTSYNVRVPALPPAIAGDIITVDESLTANNPHTFDKSMLNQIGDIISSDYDTIDSNSSAMFQCATSVEAKDLDNKLYLVTDYVFPGGYQYNYQDMKLSSGTLNNMKPADMSFSQWVDAKEIERQTYPTIGQTLSTKYYSTWYMVDGSQFRFDSKTGLDIDVSINETVKAYEETVGLLYKTKYLYQTSHLYNLLKLEASADTSDALFSINTTDNALVMY